ncbi:MAG: alanine--tRNA ligase [Bacteroidales bacterium]|nr:alanine--tRNA ligase [Bacteroidales bacterium]
MTSKEIRKAFLDFFASKGHTIVPSAPMVLKNDPTLMFTNAGMNQFKDWFLGNSEPAYKRVADTQKCLRVSGKHNDLEEVGHDAYHHTMFEMLGNWSFGDYFKAEAIAWGWELLTKVYGIPKERLYVTVFEGDTADGTERDSEAEAEWRKHIAEDRILTGGRHDNFWEMGDTGPCGPCSEIHIDLRDEAEMKAVPGRELINKGNPLVIELWNLVFIQYNRKADGKLEPLPAKHIDTGMGFERLCMVLQGKQSNYDTDVFTGMLRRIEELSGHKYGAEAKTDVAMRVVADHIRAISFSIADGQLPSNVKAGYVTRRILRRAVRYGYTFLGFGEPFLCRLVGQLVGDMGEAYPELAAQQGLIERVIREEELAFLRTLDRGIRLMDSIMEKVGAAGSEAGEVGEAGVGAKVISGVDAFTLYDTYGFPLDLSLLMAAEKGYTINIDEFNVELLKQKERARNASHTENGDWCEYVPCNNVEFLGYDCLRVEEAVLSRSRMVKTKDKVRCQLVFDRTPFYGEMGGEVGDTGWLTSADGERIRIVDTVKENNLPIHIVEKMPENCVDPFVLEVDEQRRLEISANHSSTHLLHKALREILGTHVEQKGSFVCDKYFRFDFSHFEKMSDEQLRAVEKRVNELIRLDSPLDERRDVDINEAKASGAMALFGEKYGNKVRVIRFGESVELCGGCHISSTGRIGYFRITSETAIAAGVRRIEAVTGVHAERAVDAISDMLLGARALFHNVPDLAAAIRRMLEENDRFRKEMEEVAGERAEALRKELLASAKEINGVRVVTITRSLDPNLVKTACQRLRQNVENLAVAAAFSFDEKPNLLLMYSDDLVAKGKNAGNDVRTAAKEIQGGGGGQPGLATAGGKNIAGLEAALGVLVELAGK